MVLTFAIFFCVQTCCISVEGAAAMTEKLITMNFRKVAI
jgi:hypothetical protein